MSCHCQIGTPTTCSTEHNTINYLKQQWPAAGLAKSENLWPDSHKKGTRPALNVEP